MSQAHLKYQLIAELLSLLEKERFRFGVDRHLKLQELWSKLPEDMPVEQLKQTLCPAIATNEQQQNLFYELFDEAWERVQAVNKKEEIPGVRPIHHQLVVVDHRFVRSIAGNNWYARMAVD